MANKTRQDVLRAAADWMDVCQKAGIPMKFKFDGKIHTEHGFRPNYNTTPSKYEFPLALLEGKEVWVGSKLYDENGFEFFVKDFHKPIVATCSWNPPKPKTVMVEIPFDTAEWYAANKYAEAYQPYFVSEACKKALESMK